MKKFLEDIFTEGQYFSLSRVSFMISLVVGLSIAVTKGDIPPGVVTVMGSLLIYAFTSKTNLNATVKASNASTDAAVNNMFKE